MHHKRSINIILWNTTSVKTKILELHNFLLRHHIDIALITETWLTPTDTIRLQGYEIIRRDRPTSNGKTQGGGVLIAIHRDILSEDTIQPATTQLETVTITIKTKHKITIGAAYAPPATRTLRAELGEIINKRSIKYFLIGGDFNAKHQHWNNLRRNASGTTLKRHAEVGNYQIIHSPSYTYRQPNSLPSNLDIFLSNLPYPQKATTIDALSSNHLPVKLTLELDSEIRKPYKTHHTNCNQYRQICNTYKICTEIKTPETIDQQIEQLRKNISNAYHKATQKHTPQGNQQNSDQYLRDLITRRNRHRRKYQKTGNPVHKLFRNMLTAQIQKRLRQIKNQEWQEKLRKIKTTDHTLWQTYKLTGGAKTKIPVINDTQNGNTYYGDHQKAEAITENFAEIHDKAHKSTSPLDTQVEQSLRNEHASQQKALVSISPRLVQQLIKKLPNEKAPGPDKITTQQLKNLPMKSIVQLYYILKSCLQTSYFPDPWKVAKVLPVPKPGKSKSDLRNYRPISLLSHISKILERIIHTQLLTHLKQNQIIIPQQFGFREKHSCTQQLLRVTEHTIMELNKNRYTQLVLLDVEKAFDSVWHDALIYKLQKIETPEYIIRIIRSYLTNRRMYITVNGVNSLLKHIKAGVPQGSILGPTLYTIYTNDIPTSDKTNLAIYADDTAIYTSWKPRQATKHIQEHLNTIVEFFDRWKLRVNPHKTQAITTDEVYE